MLAAIIFCTLACATTPQIHEALPATAVSTSPARLDEQSAWTALNAIMQSHAYPERGPMNRQPLPDYSEQQQALAALLPKVAGTSAEPHLIFHLASTLYQLDRFADALAQFSATKEKFPKHGLCVLRDLADEKSLSLVNKGISDCLREIEIRKNYEVKTLPVAKLDPKAKAVFHTSLGDFEMMFFSEVAPKTVANMKKLIKSGYYGDTYIHQVRSLRHFTAGCPRTKEKEGIDRNDDGSGGPGYELPLEFSTALHTANSVSMLASAGTGRANGSQFVVCINAQPQLNRTQAVFAQVISGMDVIKNITKQVADDNDNPYERIWIRSVEWIENP
ncbi:MAG: peptidylprolyl isomerase [Planctomycetota bacterium]